MTGSPSALRSTLTGSPNNSIATRRRWYTYGADEAGPRSAQYRPSPCDCASSLSYVKQSPKELKPREQTTAK